ncbi:MAG: hypothetical protein H7A25_04240 [Leptospiraceae bacterium]|nr:hypothetical protein [Leptospiraceae bacterium]MCP5499086.1 hypothetical protein [Leptospiraceae bacterium]
MVYEDFNPDIKSNYTRVGVSTANIVSDTLLPSSGLRARDLLNSRQLMKLKRIRSRRLSQEVLSFMIED